MNEAVDLSEWEQCNDGIDLEDLKQKFYDQIQGWVQKNVEVKKKNAEVDAEFRSLRGYAKLNGIDMTAFLFPEGRFVMK